MRKGAVFTGWAAIAIIIIAWNWTVAAGWFDPSTTNQWGEVVRKGQHVAIWTPGWMSGLVAALVWYGLACLNSIKEWNRRPVLLFGRYVRTAGPGLVLIEPIFYTTLDDIPVQDVVIDIEVPNVQTQDNVGVDVKGVLTFRIDEKKVRNAVVEVGDVMRAVVKRAVVKRAVATANDIGSTTLLDHFLESRVEFSTNVVEELRKRVSRWGVTIHALELRGFKINDADVEKAIAMKARAQKEAAAELTRAEMQKQIAEKLDEAASKYTPEGRWLKSIEVLVELCRSANNTILIPSDAASGIGALLPKLLPGPKAATPVEGTPSTTL